MIVRPNTFVESEATLETAEIAPDELDAANTLLAEAFDVPKELFDLLGASLSRLPGCRWYVGRVAGAVVTTALGITHEGATGVFNVATPPKHRARGYGTAITARAVRDGLTDGASFAYLQSSESGHGVYRRLGFRDVEQYTLFTRPFES
jgi:ribosomal protein S18 acetylase RimI-like enzyme